MGSFPVADDFDFNPVSDIGFVVMQESAQEVLNAISSAVGLANQ